MGTDVQRVFYGWVVLACVSTVLLLTYGVQYAFGVFFTTMLPDLGWSRAGLAGAFSLYSLVYIGLSSASGHFTDRLGPRWVMSLGGCCLGSGLILVSQIQAPWQLYLFYGGLSLYVANTAMVTCNFGLRTEYDHAIGHEDMFPSTFAASVIFSAERGGACY